MFPVARFGALVLALSSSDNARIWSGDNASWKRGFDTIVEADVRAHAHALAGPELEGRDTPSAGLLRSAQWIAERFVEAGLVPCDPPATGAEAELPPVEERMLRPWRRVLPTIDAERSRLKLSLSGAEDQSFAVERDFVPVHQANGEAQGPLIFVGFGIKAPKEGFDETKGKELEGAIALILEGEPRHPRVFDGPEVSQEADLFEKLGDLKKAKVAGVIVARRAPPPGVVPKGMPKNLAKLEPARMGLRSTWAEWVGSPGNQFAPSPPPTIEVSLACATVLLGEDLAKLAERGDKSGKPHKAKLTQRQVEFVSATRDADVAIPNVVGLVRGADSDLASEFVVLGAHYDHVGVDPRGRIGFGADDNASGTSALVELAQALALAPPRRSVILCAFSGEEDGLLGSQAFCRDPPVAAASLVAMINLDMIGRGDVDEVAVLGIQQTPSFEGLLGRAQKLGKTGVKKVVMRQGEDLWQRSDHHSFHAIDVPSLFFFEGLPIERNQDYHTWRDTLDKLDFDKMTRTTRLVFNTAWLLANDDARPPKPSGSR